MCNYIKYNTLQSNLLPKTLPKNKQQQKKIEQATSN